MEQVCKAAVKTCSRCLCWTLGDHSINQKKVFAIHIIYIYTPSQGVNHHQKYKMMVSKSPMDIAMRVAFDKF